MQATHACMIAISRLSVPVWFEYGALLVPWIVYVLGGCVLSGRQVKSRAIKPYVWTLCIYWLADGCLCDVIRLHSKLWSRQPLHSSFFLLLYPPVGLWSECVRMNANANILASLLCSVQNCPSRVCRCWLSTSKSAYTRSLSYTNGINTIHWTVKYGQINLYIEVCVCVCICPYLAEISVRLSGIALHISRVQTKAKQYLTTLMCQVCSVFG